MGRSRPLVWTRSPEKGCTPHLSNQNIQLHENKELMGIFFANQAIFTSDRRPGLGALLTIFFAISREAVAAWEGVLHT